MSNQLKAFRSSFLDFVDDPFYVSELESVRYIADGLLVVEDGLVKELGEYESLYAKYVGIEIVSYPGMLIMPGFIDTHVHFPQTEAIASYGEQLLEWLNKYIFPTERKFQEFAYAQKIAAIFLDELLKNGTTTALVFAAVFPESVEAFFTEASRRNLRAIAGKVMMDRNAPDYLIDTPEISYQQSKQLIEKWHKNGRLLYAVTPRFAITSSAEQLSVASRLLDEFPDIEGYLDVYDRAGLVRNRSIFAHGVHLTDAEFARLSEAESAIAFCPTSNLFLGSGLFKLEKAKSNEHPVKLGLGTDVGAGTSFSLLQTAGEAYKVAQLRKQKLSPFQALFLATLGGARALGLEDKLGNFETGKEADFIVIDPRCTELLTFRNGDATAASIAELAAKVFTLMVVGSDRSICATYILGNLAYERLN